MNSGPIRGGSPSPHPRRCQEFRELAAAKITALQGEAPPGRRCFVANLDEARCRLFELLQSAEARGDRHPFFNLKYLGFDVLPQVGTKPFQIFRLRMNILLLLEALQSRHKIHSETDEDARLSCTTSYFVEGLRYLYDRSAISNPVDSVWEPVVIDFQLRALKRLQL